MSKKIRGQTLTLINWEACRVYASLIVGMGGFGARTKEIPVINVTSKRAEHVSELNTPSKSSILIQFIYTITPN